MIKQSIVALLILSALTASARAALIVGNLTASSPGQHSLVAPSTHIAGSFVLDGTFTPSNLTSITLSLGVIAGGSATAAVQLYADNASLPGAPLVSLGTMSIVQSVPNDYTFTPVSGFVLNPGTRYWIGLNKVSGGGLLQWQFASPTIDPGSDPAAGIPNSFAQSIDSASTWTPTGQPNPLMFAVNGTPVPAPGAAALLCLGGLLTSRRRRR